MKFEDIQRKHQEECKAYIQTNSSKIFKCRENSYHFNTPFSVVDTGVMAGGETLFTEGYGKIIGYQKNGNPLVRMLTLEKWFKSHPFPQPDDKPEGDVIVNLRNWTGYSFGIISSILDDFVEDESTLHPFILDSFYNDDFDMMGGKWRISFDDLYNNERPWLKRKEILCQQQQF